MSLLREASKLNFCKYKPDDLTLEQKENIQQMKEPNQGDIFIYGNVRVPDNFLLSLSMADSDNQM